MQWATQLSGVTRKSKSRITPMRRRRTYLAALEALETRQLLSAGDSMANAIDLGAYDHQIDVSGTLADANAVTYYKFTPVAVYFGFSDGVIRHLTDGVHLELIAISATDQSWNTDTPLNSAWYTFHPNPGMFSAYYLKVTNATSTSVNYSYTLLDSHAPGSTLGTAYDLGADVSLPETSSSGAVVMDGRSVIYKISCTGKSVLQCTTTASFDNGVLSAAIIQDENQNGQIDTGDILVASTNQHNIQLEFLVSPGVYYFKFDNNNYDPYTFSVTTDVLPTDTAGDTLSTATNLGVISTPVSTSEWVGAEDATDIFKFSASPTGDYAFAINNNNVYGELIVDQNNNGLVDAGEVIATSTGGAVNVRLNAGKSYFVRMTNQAGMDNAYTFNLTATINPDTAGGTFDSARDLGMFTQPITVDEWVGTTDATDVYTFTVNGFQDVTIANNNSNITYALYCIQQGNATANNKILISNTSANAMTSRLYAGSYYLRVTNTIGSSNFYTLDFSMVGAPAAPTKSLSSAQDIGVLTASTVISGNVSSYNDVNYYKFTVPYLSDVHVGINYVTEVVIADRNGNGIEDPSESAVLAMGGGGTMRFFPGVYYLKVINNGTALNPYNISVSNMGRIPSVPGDTISTAVDLGVMNNSISCLSWVGLDHSDEYYKFSIANAATLAVSINGNVPGCIFRDRNGNGQIDAGEALVWSVNSGGLYPYLQSGNYYLKISSNSQSNYYGLGFRLIADDFIRFPTWNQEGYIANYIKYNNYTPLDPVTNQRSLVGCSPVAAAQIMDYWNFPSSLTLNSNDAYVSQSSGSSTINIMGDATRLQFPTFSTLNSALSTINYADPSDEAYLAFALGIVVQADFSSEGTSSYFGAADFRRLGFVSAQDSANWDAVKPTVITNLQAGQPVMLDVDVANDSVTPGHAFILDGYNPADGTFHCNFGWGGAYDGWYSPPSFNVNGTNYNHISGITYNIAPPVAAPVNLMVSADSTPGHEQIYWDATLLATGYQVWRSTSNNPATATNITPQNLTATTYTDTSGRSYYYWVKAVNANGSSAFSSVLPVVPNYTPLVTNLYRDVLGRAPDTAGLNNWLSALGNGTTNAAQIAAGFTGSVEYRTNRINEVYRSILNRNADQNGFNSWLSYLGNGHTLEEMKAGFYGSPEYRARRGGTNIAVVTAYYREILGRAPDAEGLAHWMTLLNSGSTATQVAYAIMSSSYEGAGLIVRRCYTTYLHRDPDTAGYQSWVNRILHGTSEVTIITGFLGSPEYARRG